MGRIANSIVAYAQPLLDETDGSLEQTRKAMSIAQMCWNLALASETEQEAMLAEMRPAFKMDADEFTRYRESVIAPMILRHHEMFPNMPRQGFEKSEPSAPGAAGLDHPSIGLHRSEAGGTPARPSRHPLNRAPVPSAPREMKYQGTGRNEPCPCNSGKKYKRCCGR